MEWMLMPLKRYAEFGGRSRRKEYWLFFLFTVVASMILGVIDSALGLTFGASTGATGPFRNGNGVLGSIFSLATFLPSLAVGVRRLHDTDRTGWWILLPVAALVVGVIAIIFAADRAGFYAGLLLMMIPVGVSLLVLLVLFCLPGTPGPNRHGPDPKGQDLGDVFA